MLKCINCESEMNFIKGWMNSPKRREHIIYQKQIKLTCCEKTLEFVIFYDIKNRFQKTKIGKFTSATGKYFPWCKAFAVLNFQVTHSTIPTIVTMVIISYTKQIYFTVPKNVSFIKYEDKYHNLKQGFYCVRLTLRFIL